MLINKPANFDRDIAVFKATVQGSTSTVIKERFGLSRHHTCNINQAMNQRIVEYAVSHNLERPNILDSTKSYSAERDCWLQLIAAYSKHINSGIVLSENSPLTELGLPLRAFKALSSNGFQRVGQVAEVINALETGVFKIPSCGEAAINSIKQKLTQAGF